MASATQEQPESLNALAITLLLGGGLSVGTGLLNLYWGFGFTPGDSTSSVDRVAFNQSFSGVGFTGLDNITILSSAHFAIPLIVIGVLAMVFVNASAWRQTGGY